VAGLDKARSEQEQESRTLMHADFTLIFAVILLHVLMSSSALISAHLR
jgi:hypothetical protein